MSDSKAFLSQNQARHQTDTFSTSGTSLELNGASSEGSIGHATVTKNNEILTSISQSQTTPSQEVGVSQPTEAERKGKVLKTRPIATRPFRTARVSANAAPASTKVMQVKKRDGTLEPVNVNKIVQAVLRCSGGLDAVDPMRVATKAISGLYDGASTTELDLLCIRTAALLIYEEPEYSKLASRMLSQFMEEEVHIQHVWNFAESVAVGHKAGIINPKVLKFVQENAAELNAAINPARNDLFEYFGLRTLYDRYLLKNPTTRAVFETPQYFFMRVAVGLSQSVEEALELYDLISSLDYMPSTPTLFNSATQHSQLSSCYLLDSPQDDLSSIYEKYKDVAMLSKFAGGIGLAYHRVRSRGSLIKGTNGHSNGIVPWLKTLDSSVAAVNQGGKRKGACCVYLETWHGDIEEFLELRENTGDEAQRTHNINLANWVPDLFMRRVEGDQMWSLFDPKDVPHFVDLYGEAFEKAYTEAEAQKKFRKQVSARDLYSRMMKALAQTGNGWMTFKDTSNLKSNQTGSPENVIHLSNLCTEILEVTSNNQTAVCNLGSINLSKHVVAGRFDMDKLGRTVRTAVKYLDRVIDINYYPIDSAASSNKKWRPVGLGVMGLQDVFFQLGIAFDSDEARELSSKIQEEVYFNALATSCELSEQSGPHPSFAETKAAKGLLQFDLWGVTPSKPERWNSLKKRVVRFGLRNSLLIAIAPTATIAAIVGSFESIEPQVSNFFKRETLSGEFIQINRYLVRELKARGLWTQEIRDQIKIAEGSIASIDEIPEDLKIRFRTAWELPMRSLVDMAAERGAYIDQSQSLNLFVESPSIGKLSSMYMYAWKKGLKTTYYMRSRPATKIKKVTASYSETVSNSEIEESVSVSAPGNESLPGIPLNDSALSLIQSAQGAHSAHSAMTPKAKTVSDIEAVTCSLENPESCESCT